MPSLALYASGFVAGTPPAGYPVTNQNISQVSGLAFTYRNVLADSPPGLLEQYVITGYSIPFTIAFLTTSAPPAQFSATMTIEFDVDGQTVHRNTGEIDTFNEVENPTTTDYSVWNNSVLEADLVNPIIVGGRSRLGIKALAQSFNYPGSTGGGPYGNLAAQITGTTINGNYQAFNYASSQGNINYVSQFVPPTRRL